MEEKAKVISAAIGGFFATIAKQYSLIIWCVVFVIVFDVITGLIKSKVKGTPWNSQRGSKGFWKKIGLLAALTFGIFMDLCIPVMLEVVKIELPFRSPFGLIVGVYILLNESISICENLYSINPKSLPKWAGKLLRSAAKKINDEEDKSNDK